MKLDINKGTFDKLIAFEGDNLLKNEVISLMQDGNIVDLTGLTCDMAYVDINNGNGDIIESLNISNPTNGEIELPINSSLTKKDGIYDCELRLKSSSNGYVKFTAFFSLVIKANVFNKIGNKLLSNDSFSKIEEILKQADGYNKELDKKIDTINLSISTADALNAKLVNNTNTANTTNTDLESNIEEGKRTNEDSTTKDTALKETIKSAERINEELVGNENQATLNEEARKKNEAERIEAEKIRDQKINEFGSQVTKNAAEINNAKGEHDSLKARLDKDNEKVYETINSKDFLPFEGENITVEHSKVGFTKDMVVEGRTLQNLWNKEKEAGEQTVFDLKPNTDYTYIIKTLTTGIQINYRYVLIDGSITPQGKAIDASSPIGTTFSNKINRSDLKSICFLSVGSVKADYKVIILEGDCTKKETPEYFEDIKSAGEKEGKVSILSQNDNFISEVNLGLLNVSDGEEASSDKYYRSNFIRNVINAYYVKTDSDYIITNIFEYDNLKRFVKQTSITGAKTFTITNPYFRIVGRKQDSTIINDLNYKNIVVGSKIYDTYFERKQDKKEILLTDGLKGLPSGVGDTVEARKDGVYHVQKVKKIIFDGSSDEDITLSSENDNFIKFAYTNHNFDALCETSNIICDTFPTGIQNVSTNLITGEYVYIGARGGWSIIFVIKKSKLETLNVTGFKKWLQANPTTIYYELETPIETKLDITSLNLETFKDITHVLSENAIAPNLSFKAPVDVRATISTLRVRNENLEQENKELKEEVDMKTLRLHGQDVELTNSDLDLDFRIFELEMSLDIPMNINMKGMRNMARSPYEMMKILILNNNYDREDIEYKASKYLKGGRMTQAEYDEIISLMDANELVK